LSQIHIHPYISGVRGNKDTHRDPHKITSWRALTAGGHTMKVTKNYMSKQTQNELLQQIFIQETRDNKRPIIREDFAEWLGLENAVFWVASTYIVWKRINIPSEELCLDVLAGNLLALQEVFGLDLKGLIDLILADIREISEEELRHIEEQQKGKVLS